MPLEITENEAFEMGVNFSIHSPNPFAYGFTQYDAFATGMLTQVIMRAGARLAEGVSMVEIREGRVIDYSPILSHVMDADATCQN